MNQTIALIDDDENIIDLYKPALEKAGFVVLIAKNGRDGLRLVKEKKPDLILTDIVMEVKDGFWLLEKLQKDESVKNIPAIALSNLDSDEDKDEALNLGAKKFMLKTRYTPTEIVSELKNFLK